MDITENRERQSLYQTDEQELQFLSGLNNHLEGFEQNLAVRCPVSDQPIVLIGGLQRSGTTLLYQLLAQYCEVGYINNLMARFWKAPLTGALLSKHLLRQSGSPNLDFNSEYGVTKGAEGPHEFGYFWSHWLQLESATTHLLTDQEASRVNWGQLARCLAQLASIFHLPLVLKNPIACWNALRLHSYLPNLALILVERDLFYIIQSTYLARKKRYGGVQRWWSLKPPEFHEILKEPDPVHQVVSQILASQKVLDQLRQAYPGICLQVEYQSIRQQPNEVIRIIAEKFGLRLRQHIDTPAPTELPDGDQRKVSVEEYRAIDDALCRLRERYTIPDTSYARAS